MSSLEAFDAEGISKNEKPYATAIKEMKIQDLNENIELNTCLASKDQEIIKQISS